MIGAGNGNSIDSQRWMRTGSYSDKLKHDVKITRVSTPVKIKHIRFDT